MSAILPEFLVRTARMTLRPLREADRAEFVRMHEVSREFHAPWSPTLAAADTMQTLFDKQLRRTIDKIVARVGRRVDESQPYVDARLPDGSRVNAIIPPLAVDGPVLTIRKF